MSHGLQIQGSYTWGKSIDINSGVIAGDSFLRMPSPVPTFRFELESRALPDYNIGRSCNQRKLATPDEQVCQSIAGPGHDGWEVGGFSRSTTAHLFTPSFGTGMTFALGHHRRLRLPEPRDKPRVPVRCPRGNPNHYIKTSALCSNRYRLRSSPNSFRADVQLGPDLW